MPKLTIVFHHAGGGHRNAADAVRGVLTQNRSPRNPPWDVELLDIQELLDPLDLIRRFTGIRIQDVYNQILQSSTPFYGAPTNFGQVTGTVNSPRQFQFGGRFTF